MRIGFDHDKYTAMQSEHILERINKFGGKLYLELGGKLFDDFHAPDPQGAGGACHCHQCR